MANNEERPRMGGAPGAVAAAKPHQARRDRSPSDPDHATSPDVDANERVDANEHDPLRGVTDRAQTVQIPATIEEATAALRAMMEREREKGLALGLIVPGAPPRRKRRHNLYCENDQCPDGNSLWGPAAVYGEGEHPAWLDGRRKDAAFCSNRCRQAHYRARDRRDREEWWEALQTFRAIFVEEHGEDRVIPLNARTWKKWRDIVVDAIERLEARREADRMSEAGG